MTSAFLDTYFAGARSRLRTLGLTATALTLVALACAALGPSGARADLPTWTNPNLNTDGIQVSSVVEIPPPPNGPTWDGTLLDISMKPSAIWTTVHTRVYLPAGYAHDGAPYPTLYLLHGAGESIDAARAWSDPSYGNVGEIVDSSPFDGIVIMPEGGRAGWYTNWVYADLANHKLNWQSFHLDQLRSWIDGHLNTVATKAGRAIAGLSMGGHGALSYAAQRPELFSRAASFSGPGDITEPAIQQLVIANQVTKFGSTLPLYGSAIYKSEEGDFFKRALDVQTVIGAYGSSAWTRKNPYVQGPIYLAHQIEVTLYAGYGGVVDDPGGSALEYASGIANDKMFTKFKADGLQVRYCTGVGSHVWQYWREDLKDWLRHAYGGQSPSATCPNNWGAPRP